MTYRVVGDLISKAKIEKCGDGNFPVLSMTMHDGIVFQGERFKKQIASVDQSIYNIVRRDQLVVSFPIDEGVLAIQDIADAGIVSPAYKIWDIDQSKVIPKYLELFLRSPHSIQYYKAKLRGSTARRRSITDDDLMNMELPILSKEEQQHVIDALNKTKGLIDSRKTELEKLDELIKARFVELFGDPSENPYCFPEVNISTVVDGKASNGYFAKRDEYVDDGNVSVLGVAYVVNRMYSQVTDLPRTNADEKSIQKFAVKYGDMLFCRSSLVAAGIGKASIVPEEVPANTLFECHVIRLPLDLGKCVPEYMQTLSTMEYFRNQIIAQSKTATMTTIGQDGILKTSIVLPPLENQKEFYRFVKQVDKSKVVEEKKTHRYQ